MQKSLCVSWLVCLPLIAFAQISGVVQDLNSGEPIIGAKVFASDGNKTLTDFDGAFTLSCKSFPVTLVTKMLQYTNDSTVLNSAGDVTIKLGEPVTDLQMVVVSAGRRKQAIEEVPVSIEIIKPELIDNKGITSLDQAVEQTPGVSTFDGQVSIRGGSGFSYGAGSRVLLLWNGMPLLSGYAGDTQWNAIPMEQAAQIEVMKGASSVLYGSGALNGIIAIREREPGTTPVTKLKVQYGIYDNPRRTSLRWWDTNPMTQQIEFYRSQMFKNVGYTISSTLFHDDGYKNREFEFRGRVSGTFYYRPKKWSKVKAGISYNYQVQKTGNFIIWESDTLGYTPQGGIDTSNAASTLTYTLGQRLFIDPYVKIIDKHNNRHSFKNRMYYVKNVILGNESQNSIATIYNNDYQFQKSYANGLTLTSGASSLYNVVIAELFGSHTSWNSAIFTQIEHHIGKFDFTAGLRLEYFEMDGERGDSDFLIPKLDSTVLPFYPVARSGFHYKLAEYTHLRASLGQGIRYPAVGERFIQTSVGALNVFPNPTLRPEIGWAGEIGIKQGVKIGDWKGMLDISGFVNEYQNMIEFTFGVYNPDNIILNTTDPEDEGYIYKWIGFRAQNAESARITGVDFSFNSMGSIGDFEIVSLIGYTYMNPISLNNNPDYQATFSDTTGNILKYRFNHLAKLDIEVTYKKTSAGVSMRYGGFMRNIDKVFEEPIGGTTYILPGLKEYRQIYNKGNLVFDARLGYKLNDQYRLGFMVNNLFNSEYTSRPGDIQPPRNFSVQVQMKF
ncbi:MAG: TonB-dependent receptor [Crocinitomicaceae bacterium]|nr:TonB-dependent receptor [Crocinitomicaceae bacterium]MDG2505776.1 TonB-dependent receptor [Crocinitomicaceae bacterium]